MHEAGLEPGRERDDLQAAASEPGLPQSPENPFPTEPDGWKRGCTLKPWRRGDTVQMSPCPSTSFLSSLRAPAALLRVTTPPRRSRAFLQGGLNPPKEMRQTHLRAPPAQPFCCPPAQLATAAALPGPLLRGHLGATPVPGELLGDRFCQFRV